MVGVCGAGTVSLPHGGAVGTLCAFSWWFCHHRLGYGLRGWIERCAELKILSPAEHVAERRNLLPIWLAAFIAVILNFIHHSR